MLLSDFTFRRTPHAFCGYRAWPMPLLILLTISLNTGGSSTVSGEQRPATTCPCMSLGTSPLCFRNSEHDTLRASSTWCNYSLKQAPSLTISLSPAGAIIIARNKMADRLANIAMDRGTSVQAHASSNLGIAQKATTFLHSDVNHWLETSQTDQYVIRGSILTPRILIISRQESARRRSAIRDLVLHRI